MPLSQCLRGLFLQSLLCVLFEFRCRHLGQESQLWDSLPVTFNLRYYGYWKAYYCTRGRATRKERHRDFQQQQKNPQKIKENSKENSQSPVGRNFCTISFS